MDSNVEDCPVCLTAFDDTSRRPRTFPCGHTCCTPCIELLKQQDEVTCPTCRVIHAVPEAGQFPVCYAVEALLRRLRDVALASLPPKLEKHTAESTDLPVTGSTKKGTVGLSKKAQSMLQEQKAKVLAAISTCQGVQAQLDQYCTILGNLGDSQQQLEDELQALVDQTKSARVLVRHEETQAVAKKEEVYQGEQLLHALLQPLDNVTLGEEAYKIIDDADHCTEEESQRAEECLGMFPDVHTITTITKVREASRVALEAATTVQAALETVSTPTAAEDSGLPAALASSIKDRLEVLLAPALKVEDLRSLTQPARNLLQAGLVFAVHQVKEQRRHARISLQDGRLYLESLQNQPQPHCGVTVQMSKVMPAVPPCLVFMDMAWPGSAPRRVFIRLSRDTPRGRQFLLLCMGKRGSCYANTNLFEVKKEGQSGEYVWAGDYDGKGGAALLPNLDQGKYKTSLKAGSIGWRKSDDTCMGAQFCIITKDSVDVNYNTFGDVVEGLEVVVEAVHHHPITEVTVVECGVVLWE